MIFLGICFRLHFMYVVFTANERDDSVASQNVKKLQIRENLIIHLAYFQPQIKKIGEFCCLFLKKVCVGHCKELIRKNLSMILDSYS